jgi:hypothetical protein
MPDPLATLITAAAAGVAAFVGAILKPWYEDRIAQRRETRQTEGQRRADRRARLLEVETALADIALYGTAREREASARLPSLAVSTGDEQLIGHVEAHFGAPAADYQGDARQNAKRRVGELLRDA